MLAWMRLEILSAMDASDGRLLEGPDLELLLEPCELL